MERNELLTLINEDLAKFSERELEVALYLLTRIANRNLIED